MPEQSFSNGGFDPGVFVFFLIFGLPFINTALLAKGPAGWFLGFFLAPFFFAFSAAVFGATVGLVFMAIWLVAFPVLRLVLPKSAAGKRARSRGGFFWGPSGSGGGGGFSGGGFSGGGGSFGGGGASGGW